MLINKKLYLTAALVILYISFNFAFASEIKPVKINYSKYEFVLVEWKGKWWNAQIVRRKNHRYRVHYNKASKKWDEWVKIDRIAKKCNKTSG